MNRNLLFLFFEIISLVKENAVLHLYLIDFQPKSKGTTGSGFIGYNFANNPHAKNNILSDIK